MSTFMVQDAALAVAERHRPHWFGPAYIIDAARLSLHRQPRQLEVVAVAYDCYVGGWHVDLTDDELQEIVSALAR